MGGDPRVVGLYEVFDAMGAKHGRDGVGTCVVSNYAHQGALGPKRAHVKGHVGRPAQPFKLFGHANRRHGCLGGDAVGLTLTVPV